jgi:AraC family transcriptional regulator, arabinose operon regulatory protein
VSLGAKPRPYYKQVALHVPSELEHAFPYRLLRVGREQYTDSYPRFRGRVMDVHHLVYVEQGRGWLRTGSRRDVLSAGSVALLLEGTTNDMGPEPDDPMEITWLVLDGDGLTQLMASVGLTVFRPHVNVGAGPEMRAIFRELRLRETGYVWRVQSLLWAILGRIAMTTGARDMGAPPPAHAAPHVPDDWPGRPVGPPPPAATAETLTCDDPAVARAVDLIRLHFPEPHLHLSHLAAAACLGRTRFIQRFKQATGTSPRQHLERVRMEEARRLLEEGLPVVRVAEMAGFEDPLYFSRRFRAMHGVAPTAYRAVVRGARGTRAAQG